jgi:hypothetical protein
MKERKKLEPRNHPKIIRAVNNIPKPREEVLGRHTFLGVNLPIDVFMFGKHLGSKHVIAS